MHVATFADESDDDVQLSNEERPMTDMQNDDCKTVGRPLLHGL